MGNTTNKIVILIFPRYLQDQTASTESDVHDENHSSGLFAAMFQWGWINASAEPTQAGLTITTRHVRIIIRDADGEIIEGDPSRIRTAQEIWTFERNTGARDPNWVLGRVRRA